MGLGFLALAWNALGDRDKAAWYLRRLESAATRSGELPEAWCANPAHDEYYNSPLCWSHALHVVASHDLDRRKAKIPAAGAEPQMVGGAQSA